MGVPGPYLALLNYSPTGGWCRMVNGIQDLARTVRQIPTRYAPVRHFVLNCELPHPIYCNPMVGS